MFLGHFAVALASKKAAPRVSLGTLFFSVSLVDLLWPILLLLGLEHVKISPGITVVTPLDFYDYPITHSLVTSLGWSLLTGLLFFAWKKDLRSSVVVGLAVLSHWILDFLTTGPTFRWLPGIQPSWDLDSGIRSLRPLSWNLRFLSLLGTSTCAQLKLNRRAEKSRYGAGPFLSWSFISHPCLVRRLRTKPHWHTAASRRGSLSLGGIGSTNNER